MRRRFKLKIKKKEDNSVSTSYGIIVNYVYNE